MCTTPCSTRRTSRTTRTSITSSRCVLPAAGRRNHRHSPQALYTLHALTTSCISLTLSRVRILRVPPQMLCTDANPPQYSTWNRWGRVGEERGMQNAFRSFGSNKEAAKTDFCKKFWDKTKNQWADRDKFRTVSGKYTLLEKDYGQDEPPASAAASSSSGGGPAKPIESKLDKRVQVRGRAAAAHIPHAALNHPPLPLPPSSPLPLPSGFHGSDRRHKNDGDGDARDRLRPEQDALRQAQEDDRDAGLPCTAGALDPHRRRLRHLGRRWRR